MTGGGAGTAAADAGSGRRRTLGRSYAALTAALLLGGLLVGEVLLLATGLVTGLLGLAGWAYVAGSRVEGLRWLYARRTAWPSREGWIFSGLALALGLAAVNTGANLLYLVFAMMCAGFLVSGFLCLNAVRGVRVESVPPAPVPVGEAATLRVRIENRKWLLPSHSLRVDVARAPDGLSLSEAAFVPRIAGRGRAEGVVRIACRRRGLHSLGGWRLSTDFPFGLVRKSVWHAGGPTLTVLPRVGTLSRAAVRGRAAPSPRPEGADGRRPGDAEFHGLRDYRHGDNPRRIHWRSSARAQKLLVRDLREELAAPAIVCVAGRGDGPALDPTADVAATLLRAFRLRGRAPILALAGDPPIRAVAGDGAGDEAARLALARWTGGSPARVLDALSAAEVVGATVVAIAPDRATADATAEEARRRGADSVEAWTPEETIARGWVTFERGAWEFPARADAGGRSGGTTEESPPMGRGGRR